MLLDQCVQYCLSSWPSIWMQIVHLVAHANPSPSLFSFLLSPCHLYLSFAACWKKLTCGVIRSFNFGQKIFQKKSESMADRMSTIVSESMSERMPAYMLDRISEYMKIYAMSEYILDRMPDKMLIEWHLVGITGFKLSFPVLSDFLLEACLHASGSVSSDLLFAT